MRSMRLSLCVCVACGGSAAPAPAHTIAAPEPSDAATPPSTGALDTCGDCREARTVNIRVDQEHVAQFKLQATPYTNGSIASVVLGDDYFLAADVRDGHLVNLRHVRDGGPNTLRLKLQPTPDGSVGAILTITSTFQSVLRYRAGIQVAGRDGMWATSACPVMEVAVEHWPEPVGMVAIADLRVNDPADMGCHK